MFSVFSLTSHQISLSDVTSSHHSLTQFSLHSCDELSSVSSLSTVNAFKHTCMLECYKSSMMWGLQGAESTPSVTSGM